MKQNIGTPLPRLHRGGQHFLQDPCGRAFRFAPCALAWLLMGTASAFAQTDGLGTCAVITDNADRLACYDRLAARALAPPADPAQAAESAPEPEPLRAASEPVAYSRLADQWELGEAWSRGKYRFRPYERTYLMAAFSSSPNEAPFQPLRPIVQDDIDLSPAELAFQLSFKFKLAEKPLDMPADVWFGYTQRSFWQAFNSKQSSPFRATDYRPEVMAVFPTDFKLLGMNMRMLNLGFVHESNGQGASLSRSWNRVYAQAGLERGDFSLLVRRWLRIREDADEDDNPDIQDYLGKGDIVATWSRGAHELSLLGRYNFAKGHGAAQLGWAFPLAKDVPRLKGYVQLFSGYGYSLIDYNHAQTVLGIGLTLAE